MEDTNSAVIVRLLCGYCAVRAGKLEAYKTNGFRVRFTGGRFAGGRSPNRLIAPKARCKVERQGIIV